MQIFALFLIGFVSVQHFGFLYLEMFLWKTPTGLKIFRMTSAQAESSSVLAANQGLYNGFLALGLLLSFFLPDRDAYIFRLYLLACVVIAGCYGGWTVSVRIFFLQALPALVAFALTYIFLGPRQ